MKYFRSRYNVAHELILSYHYPQPFHLYAKDFFKQHKKFGSKDRKAILEVCYTYFRTGRLFEKYDFKKSLLLACSFLSFEDVNDWNKVALELGYAYELPEDIAQNKEQFWSWLKLNAEIEESAVFYPKDNIMSDFQSLNQLSVLGFRPKVWAKDHKAKTPNEDFPLGCFELEEGELPEDFVQVQDLSSQTICSVISINDNDNVWDVCSGAGGKSLNLLANGNGQFFLSDIRANILSNASQRIKGFGYTASFGIIDIDKNPKSLVFNNLEVTDTFFDVIIADVPCSGSGTWFRTPEHFTNFDYKSIAVYVQRQKTIVSNAFPFLKSQGLFYYITCSVFEAENAEVKTFIMNNLDCELVEDIAYNGMTSFSDSMYMCCFRKK